jgi:hypothetical protein
MRIYLSGGELASNCCDPDFPRRTARASTYEDFKVGGEHGDGVERSWVSSADTGEGRSVNPCSPVIFAARTRECSGPPVRAQAARLDARSLGIFSACPSCPTCPTKIRKREQEASLFCRIFSTRFAPRLKLPTRISLRRGGQVGLVGPRQRWRALLSSNGAVSRLDDVGFRLDAKLSSPCISSAGQSAGPQSGDPSSTSYSCSGSVSGSHSSSRGSRRASSQSGTSSD